MRKTIVSLFLLLIICKTVWAQENTSAVITSDIANFWKAYDKITSTKDSIQQYEYLNALFISKGTPGLKAIMQVRDYTAKSYIDAINHYPLFWISIRANTLKAMDFAKDIQSNVQRLKALYPELKPAKVYFTMGALLTGGTTMDGMVLIGTETSLSDKNAVTSEFPAALSHLRSFFDSEPVNSIVFTNVHEYVHTQQKTTDANNLLAQSVLEGVAEFMAVKATGKPSTVPAMGYGRVNDEKIKQKFASQMFNPFVGFWLYSNAANEFGLRDLGYYVGYAICEKYYEKASDKKQAIKTMIELDYNNQPALDSFVETSGYFTKALAALKNDFEESRPTIIAIKQFKNNDASVDAALTQITVDFSAAMDKGYRNFELGPLGKSNLLLLKRFIGFSDDGKSATFETSLKPGQHYQLLLGENFRSADGISLKPYLIDFTTAGQ